MRPNTKVDVQCASVLWAQEQEVKLQIDSYVLGTRNFRKPWSNSSSKLFAHGERIRQFVVEARVGSTLLRHTGLGRQAQYRELSSRPENWAASFVLTGIRFRNAVLLFASSSRADPLEPDNVIRT